MAFRQISPYTEIRVQSYGGEPGFLAFYTFRKEMLLVKKSLWYT